MLAKKGNIDECTFMGSLQGLYKYCSHQNGMVSDLLRLVFMEHIFSFSKDLQYIMQSTQVLIFFVAHCFISVLIAHTFVIVGWDQLRWLHWKFHYN